MTPTFVLSLPFQGATLLSILLNNHSKITALGDTLPTRAHPDYFCSCGAEIRACGFWTELARQLGADRYSREQHMIPGIPRILANTDHNFTLNRYLIEFARKLGPGVWRLAPRASSDFASMCGDFYRLACQLQGTESCVDGTKDFNRFLAFKTIADPPSIKVIHVVRDPRGVYYSYRKNERASPLAQSTHDWCQYNLAVREYCGDFDGVDYQLLRYEDLCGSPQETMARVFTFLGFENESVVSELKTPHHLIGNRMLMSFDGTIKLADEWRTAVSVTDQQTIAARTGELAASFGYSL